MSFSDIFKSSFLENVTSVSLLDMALVLILSFALGLGLTFFLTRKNYAPVRQLVSSVQAMTAPGEEPVIPRGSNEFAYVMDKFRQTVDRMEDSREAARRAYLLELFNGVQPADADTFGRLSLPFEGMRFVVALLQADTTSTSLFLDDVLAAAKGAVPTNFPVETLNNPSWRPTKEPE